MENNELVEQSKSWVKANKKTIIERFVGNNSYIQDIDQFAIFMAGSPGAGKTEVSRWFIKEFIKLYLSKAEKKHPVPQITRIDPDEIREIIPGYNGANAELFQGAASLGVEKIYDYVMSKNLSVVVDGTLSNYSAAYKNIKRAVDKKRKVGVFYIYQDPIIAWDFTKKREETDGRHISKATFIESFFKARINTNKLKEDFGNKIQIFLIIKNYDNGIEKTKFNIDNIDNYLKIKYTKKSLTKKLC